MKRSSELDWRQSKVLVTGASGFLGRALVKGLVARGSRVHALVSKESYIETPSNFKLHTVALGNI